MEHRLLRVDQHVEADQAVLVVVVVGDDVGGGWAIGSSRKWNAISADRSKW
jgi:hypothetical protein